MAEVIRMPRMSDTMEEGVLVGWSVKVGDQVEPGDVLAEVETDKATMELESYFEGTLLYIGVKEGPVPVNGVLAVIGEKGEDYKAALAAAEASAPKAAATEATPAETVAAPAVASAPAAAAPSPAPVAAAPSNDRLKASPLAKAMASEAGITLNGVSGSGDNGRIVKRDVESLIANKSAGGGNQSTVAIPAFNYNGNSGPAFEDVRVSQMRKVIARRLGESKFAAPHFYLTMEIEMSNAIAARKNVNEVAPTKISFNDFVVKACAVALQQHPNINSSWMGDTIRRNKHINIGVAVGIEDGLLVPVIKHANMKSLSQINVEVKELAGRAKVKKLQPDEMTGNTFTISNLGMFGIDEFTAIINPPDACILAVGGIAQKAIVVDGELKVGNIMKVTLSCDHRVVDGVTGSQFLLTLKGLLENPVRMIV